MAAAYAYAHLRGMGSWARCTLDGGKAFIELRDRLLGEGVSQAQVMPAIGRRRATSIGRSIISRAGRAARVNSGRRIFSE